jgi:hypothetical protein
MLGLGVIALGLGLLYSWWRVSPPPPKDLPGPVGIWKVPTGELAFRYDGRYVTLEMIPRWSWEARSSDDCYRLRSRWVRNDLYVLSRWGAWIKLASFVEGRFQAGERPWVYEKVGPAELVGRERNLLRRRLPYAYGFCPPTQKAGWAQKWIHWLLF